MAKNRPQIEYKWLNGLVPIYVFPISKIGKHLAMYSSWADLPLISLCGICVCLGYGGCARGAS